MDKRTRTCNVSLNVNVNVHVNEHESVHERGQVRNVNEHVGVIERDRRVTFTLRQLAWPAPGANFTEFTTTTTLTQFLVFIRMR